MNDKRALLWILFRCPDEVGRWSPPSHCLCYRYLQSFFSCIPYSRLHGLLHGSSCHLRSFQLTSI